MIPDYIFAGLWGGIGSIGLLIGSFVGYKYNISKKYIAIVTAFSSGILISALCFELLLESYHYGNIYTLSIGFITGVVGFTIIDTFINRLNTKKQVKSNITDNNQIIGENNSKNNGININNNNINSNDKNIHKYRIIKNRYKGYLNKYQIEGLTAFAAAILDGIPESIAIGLTYFIGGPISLALLVSIFIANSFEGMSASSYMKLGGWNGKNIMGLWISVLILAFTSAMLSYIIFSHTDQHILSGALAMSAGAILAMIADTMLPEAFSETREYTGLLMAIGFLISFTLSQLKFG